MDMNGDGSTGGTSTMKPLSPKGVDFSNITQATGFLGELLDDDQLKLIGDRYARYFWYGVAVALAIAATINFTRWLTLRLRLRYAALSRQHPARPQNVILRCLATLTALGRESTYLQFTPTKSPWLRIPPMGTLLLVLAHFAFVLALEFANNSIPGAQFWQARGVRAAWLAVSQIPLLILLAVKNNPISWLVGISHERLNVLHRWTARITLFLAILHFGYQSYGWQKYGLMKLEWSTDSCPPTGIAAFALLLWMNFSTLAPFRYWSYEFFVVQHLITFFGFIIAVMYHLPTTALRSRIYIYIPIVLYFLDRCIRTLLTIYNNSRGPRATLTALEGDATKIQLTNSRIKNWSPGSYVLLSIPKFGWIQSHPATILSTPKSHNGVLVLLLKSQKGFTKRIMTSANTSLTALLPHTKQESLQQQNQQIQTYRAIANGPYGGSQSDFAAFDSVCLIAGSTGVTFLLSLLTDLAERAGVDGKRLPLRRVRFVWCVKDVSWAGWCKREVEEAVESLRNVGIDVEVNVYVTCADGLTDQFAGQAKECGCECDKSLGPCCCTLVDDGEEVVAGKQEEEGDVTAKTTAAGGVQLSVLPCAAFHSGRPEIRSMLEELLEGADGESAVAVCGPVGMSSSVRNMVVRLSDERAIHKGTGAQGCYLHVENFS